VATRDCVSLWIPQARIVPFLVGTAALVGDHCRTADAEEPTHSASVSRNNTLAPARGRSNPDPEQTLSSGHRPCEAGSFRVSTGLPMPGRLARASDLASLIESSTCQRSATSHKRKNVPDSYGRHRGVQVFVSGSGDRIVATCMLVTAYYAWVRFDLRRGVARVLAGEIGAYVAIILEAKLEENLSMWQKIPADKREPILRAFPPLPTGHTVFDKMLSFLAAGTSAWSLLVEIER
jgi:hypothetical protein